MLPYLFLILGLAFLFVGGDFLVRGAVALSLKMQVSTMVIGLTVVAFATSAPELLVSLEAALNGHTDITFGNVVGSNIANIGLILGLSSLLFVLPAHMGAYRFDWIFMISITVLMYFILHFAQGFGTFSGGLFVTLLLAYNYYKIKTSRSAVKSADLDIDISVGSDPMWKVLIFLLIGVLGLRFGASFFVSGAADIAMELGISERVVSVTMVAFGTSVPELVASIMAARKGEKDLAIGNLIGSNIFNILAVIGITALITDIPLHDQAILTFDYWWMLGFSFMLFPLIAILKPNMLGRREGAILFLGYITYIVLIIVKM